MKTPSMTRRDFLSTSAKAGATLVGGSALASAVAACGGSPSTAATESKTIAVEIDEGQNALPFQWFSAGMKAKYGVSTKIEGLPFVGQYAQIVAAMVSHSSAYDVLVFPPQMLGDFVAKGFLRKLTDYGPASAFDLCDILPAYRTQMTRNGDLYAAMYDGDTLMLTYRRDIFERAGITAPPSTWEEYLAVAKELHHPPTQYGNAYLGQRGFCYAWFFNIYAALGGSWFDSNMEPAFVNDTGVRALEMLVELGKYAPPQELNIGYPQLNEAYLNGSTAMVIQWDDLPLKTENPAVSKVVGKSGFAPCPQRTYMPYSRVMGISAYSASPHNSWKVIQYMNSAAVSVRDVYDPNCGEDPFRYSALDPSLVLTHTGQPSMSSGQAAAYVGAIKACLSAGYPELSIPGAPRYLDQLDLYVNKAIAGSATPAQALQSAAAAWNGITQSQGRSSQERAYQAWVQSQRAVGLAI